LDWHNLLEVNISLGKLLKVPNLQVNICVDYYDQIISKSSCSNYVNVYCYSPKYNASTDINSRWWWK